MFVGFHMKGDASLVKSGSHRSQVKLESFFFAIKIVKIQKDLIKSESYTIYNSFVNYIMTLY